MIIVRSALGRQLQTGGNRSPDELHEWNSVFWSSGLAATEENRVRPCLGRCQGEGIRQVGKTAPATSPLSYRHVKNRPMDPFLFPLVSHIGGLLKTFWSWSILKTTAHRRWKKKRARLWPIVVYH